MPRLVDSSTARISTAMSGPTGRGEPRLQVRLLMGKEHELISPAFIHRRLELAEYWHAITVQRAQLTAAKSRIAERVTVFLSPD